MVLPLLIGAGIGALAGGGLAAANDEPLWKGMLMGAGLGATGGAGIGALGAAGAAGGSGVSGALGANAGAQAANAIGATGSLSGLAPGGAGVAGSIAPGAGAGAAGMIGPTGSLAAPAQAGGGIGSLLSGNKGALLAAGAPMALSMLGGQGGGAPKKKDRKDPKRYRGSRQSLGPAPDPEGRERRHFSPMQFRQYASGGLVGYQDGGEVLDGPSTEVFFDDEGRKQYRAPTGGTQVGGEAGDVPMPTTPSRSPLSSFNPSPVINQLPPEAFSGRPPSYLPPEGSNFLPGPRFRPVFPNAPTTFSRGPWGGIGNLGYAEGGMVSGDKQQLTPWERFMMALFGSQPQSQGNELDQHMGDMYGVNPPQETNEEAFKRLQQEQQGYAAGGMVGGNPWGNSLQTGRANAAPAFGNTPLQTAPWESSPSNYMQNTAANVQDTAPTGGIGSFTPTLPEQAPMSTPPAYGLNQRPDEVGMPGLQDVWNNTPSLPAQAQSAVAQTPAASRFGYAEGGMVEYQDGGIAALDQPTQEASDDQSIMTEAVMAIRGEHPTPQAAIRRFIQRFGPEAFEQLMQAQQQPSDGMSDSVPALNPDGRAAALSEGEYVVPADVVSGMGNGDTRSGGEALDSMVANVRGARTGMPQQPDQIDPMQMIPA